MKVITIANQSKAVMITRTTKVTGKGQIYFVNRFLKAAEVKL